MSTIYSGTGTEYVIGQGATSTDYDVIVKGVNHRGYRGTGASENTLAAFRASKAFGFNYVETDLRFTSDDIGVLCHDATTGGLTISSSTYAQLIAANPNLARFDDFIDLCRNAIIHPYIEFKAGTDAQIDIAVDIVREKNMLRHCTWISFTASNLSRVLTNDSGARIGLLVNSVTATEAASASALKTSTNDVFLDAKSTGITSAGITACISSGIPVEAWTVDTEAAILALDYYISGVTSNSLHAGKVLFDSVF